MDFPILVIVSCQLFPGLPQASDASDLLEASAGLSHVPGKLRAGRRRKGGVLVDALFVDYHELCVDYLEIFGVHICFFLGCMDYLWIKHGLLYIID